MNYVYAWMLIGVIFFVVGLLLGAGKNFPWYVSAGVCVMLMLFWPIAIGTSFYKKIFTEQVKEKLAIWLAWRLPRRVIHWATIRLAAHATQGRYSNQVVPDLAMMDALKRWERA